ncbi:RHS repeat-associated core domain-containing protein [Dyella tabacisoli]|uniref:RHS repeat-associated core domain-containing protein n=1 Tax=Dyella tabacisoli TaxID=2282381 RepID=UPI0013B3AF04|nr:RHS repeat-associated core domain-containing protein [Dyella tabacisoli]
MPYVQGYVAWTLLNGTTLMDPYGEVMFACRVGGTTPSPAKGNGCPSCNSGVADPINAGNGNVFRREEDITAGQLLTFTRYYNSSASAYAGNGVLGLHWLHTYARSLAYAPGGSPGTAVVAVTREDGRVNIYTLMNGVWAGEIDVHDALTEQVDANGQPTGWSLSRVATRSTELYDGSGHLVGIQGPDGFNLTLSYSTTSSSQAPGAGYLLTVSDPFNRTLQFAYDNTGRITQVQAPDGQLYRYAYDTLGNLQTVTFPDGKARTYLYNEPANSGGATVPALLTGLLDETGTRYVSYRYNAAGQAISNQLAGGVAAYTLSYNGDGSADVVDPLGASIHHGFTTVAGVTHATSMGGTCQSCGKESAWTVDFRGQITQATDFNGNVSRYEYDLDGMLVSRIDGYGGATPRAVHTDWNDTFHVPTERRVLNYNYDLVSKTDWTYNARGQILAKCDYDAANTGALSYICGSSTPPTGVRRWTYTYCDTVDTTVCPVVGLRLSVDGPRTDVSDITTYSYYLTDGATAQHGDLKSVTDALGHTTTYTAYDGAGRVTGMTDANGVSTVLTYTPRGWLKTRSTDGATTTLDYDATGNVTKVTDPDGVFVSYTYDPAHRLTDITDALGNRIHYTLDAAGNKTKEDTYDSTGTVRRTLSRSYNTLGQLTTITDALNRTIFNAGYNDSYDANGNLVHTADALGVQRKQSYDGLSRLVSALDNYNGTDTATQNTSSTFAYDARDQLTGVTDPSSLTTTYTYDGLGNRTALQSPDTGSSSDTYDAAGNRLTHTDARGIVSASSYDAINRLIGTVYASTPALNVSYSYDDANSVTGCTASRPLGRLTRVVESSVTTVFCYDTRGNVTQKQQIIGNVTDTTQYTYTLAGRLSTLLTPSNTGISDTYNANGQLTNVQVIPNGSSTASAVVSAITYLPFGPVNSYTLGNGQMVTRSYDTNYALTDLTSPALNLHFARDAMGNITAEGNTQGASPAAETYSYDPLYRLTSLNVAGTPVESFTYNPTGDRLSKAGGSLATGNYVYAAGTHQLSSIGNAARTYDANGNTTASVSGGQVYGFGYNDRNRMTVVQASGATVGTYTYNAFGQRVQKVAAVPTSIIQRYAYDEASHLIGEYAGAGSRDTIWMGDIPVATVDAAGTTSTVNYIHADGLGTPRAVTSGAGTTIWSWPYAGNAFGELAPTSTNGYMLNLRFPGQYYDAESALNYNVNRDYEAATGRYIQSDPMGLVAGPSTYAYTGGVPLSATDPLGLSTMVVCRPINDWRVKWAGPVHCGVFVWHMDCNGNRIIDRQYSLAGNRTPFPQGSNAPTAVDDRNAFFSGGDGVSNWYIPPPSGMTSPQFDAAITQAGDSYNSGQDYDAKNGPNSNTAANTIIHNAGGTLPDVPGAWQQHYHDGN